MVPFNPIQFLGAEWCSSICPKNSSGNSIQMVSAPCSNHILFRKMIERLKEGVTEFVILTNHRAQLEVFSFEVTVIVLNQISENCDQDFLNL